MTKDGYWQQVLDKRASRRAVVIGGARLAGSAALLAACGGGSSTRNAATYEVSDGGLTYTCTMRQGVKFHNVAPVNGRLFDADDVVASYKRFSVGVSGVGNVNANNTGSPQYGNSFKGLVESVTSPDK